MKILFFIHSLGGGGAERIATILLNHLCEKNEVYASISVQNSNSYPTDRRIRTIIRNSNCKIIGIRSIIRLWNTYKIIKDINPDLIISFTVETSKDILLANLLTKKKIIVSERTSVFRHSFVNDMTRRYLYPFATHIVYVTKHDYETSKNIKNKSFIYNPMHLTQAKPATKKDHSIIAIGSLNRWEIKGFDILINAWGKIANLYPDWKLEIIGRCTKTPINELISKLKIEKQVSLLNWQNDIESVLINKSIYVLSSRYEGFPNSLLEAMSQGCACIATNCPSGTKEIITDGISGLIAETENADDIALKIKTLIDNQDLREKLSIGAIKEANRFDKNCIMKQWDDLIDSIVFHNSKKSTSTNKNNTFINKGFHL